MGTVAAFANQLNWGLLAAFRTIVCDGRCVAARYDRAPCVAQDSMFVPNICLVCRSAVHTWMMYGPNTRSEWVYLH